MTFFVEGYVPHLDQAIAASLSARLRAAVAALNKEGFGLAWIRSFALVEEDTYVWMVEAAEPRHVALIEQRAGIEFDHVVEVLPGEAP